MVSSPFIISDRILTAIPTCRRTVYDPQTGQDVVLSNEDVDLIKNVMSSKIPDGSYNPYQPWIDWFTSEVRETPVTSAPEHKRSFVPSRIEAIKGELNCCFVQFSTFSELTRKELSQSVEWSTPSKWDG